MRGISNKIKVRASIRGKVQDQSFRGKWGERMSKAKCQTGETGMNQFYSVRRLGVIVTLVSVMGCSQGKFDQETAQKVVSNLSQNNGSQQASLSVRIEDMSGNMIYSDSNSSTAAVVPRNSQVKVCGSPAISGTTFQVSLNNVMIGSGSASQCVTLSSGAITGNFPLKVTANAPGAVQVVRSYTIAITCDASEVAGMSASQYVTGISASGSNNSYSYSLSGPNRAGADCAIDFNGDGSADSNFMPCTQSVASKSNHVGSRNALVYVRDKACNHTMTASLPLNLAWSMPGASVQHVQGSVASLAAASGRSSSLNLQHLSINELVRCNFGNGEFNVEGTHIYNVRQGQGEHGMKMEFRGLSGSLAAGNVSGAAASLQDYDFATDFEVDKNIPITFGGSASSCIGSISVTPLPVVGVPCASAPGGQVNKYSAQFNGTFGCSNLMGSDGVSRIDVGGGKNVRSGTFMCIVAEIDACNGGGGGGGGVPPPTF